MNPIESEELAAMAANLMGRKIEVWETGRVCGLISEVTSEDGSFRFNYVTDESLEQHHIGGAWSWGRVLLDDGILHISVPLVGSAIVHL